MQDGAASAQDARRGLMLDTPINKLVIKMAVPTIISMLITSLYSLVDTYFVSMLGTYATGAVGINSSIDNIIMMAGSFLAAGASSYIARLLGAKRTDHASSVLSTAFFGALITGTLVMIFGLIFVKPLVHILGATDAIEQYAIDYAVYVLLAAPFMASTFVLNQCLRSEGSATLSMIGTLAGAILNIGLDPLFIFVFGWGIKGASAATALSKLVSFCILLWPYIRKKSVLHMSIRNVKVKKDIVTEIGKMGSPMFLRNGLSTVAAIILNNMAAGYSESALAAVSVINRVVFVLTAAMLGFGQGFMPVAGFNWGAGRYDRVRESYKFSTKAGVIGISVVSLAMFIFAEQIITLFTEADAEMIAIGAFGLRLSAVAMPFHAWCIVVNMLHSGLGRAAGAAVLGVSRQGICFIPVILILPIFFGVYGVAASQAVADILSLFVAIPFAVRILRVVSEREAGMSVGTPEPERLGGTGAPVDSVEQ